MVNSTSGNYDHKNSAVSTGPVFNITLAERAKPKKKIYHKQLLKQIVAGETTQAAIKDYFQMVVEPRVQRNNLAKAGLKIQSNIDIKYELFSYNGKLFLHATYMRSNSGNEYMQCETHKYFSVNVHKNGTYGIREVGRERLDAEGKLLDSKGDTRGEVPTTKLFMSFSNVKSVNDVDIIRA